MALSFTFLGTGCPVASPLRAGPSHLVEADGARLLVDCGSMVAQRLVAAGRPGATIDALLVTHLHSDHVVDFYQLVVSSWHQGRAKPWVVHATEPAIAAMRASYDAFAAERALRIAHERRPSAAGLEVEFHALEPGTAIRVGALEATPFLVDHRPVEPAFGLDLTAGGSRIVFSGDTRPCASLAEAARGADLLVSEVYVDREMVPAAGVRSAETVAAVRGYHMTPAEVARLAAEAQAGAVALTHLVPPAADRAALVAEVRAGYGGPVIVGEDLMTVRLPERLLTTPGLALAY
jgi:ribonuclease Z